MADYYPLLAKAVSGLAQSTPEARGLIYERARKALLGQLRNMTPPVPQAAVDHESDALDDAIRRLEADFAPASAAIAPPPNAVVEPPMVAPPRPPDPAPVEKPAPTPVAPALELGPVGEPAVPPAPVSAPPVLPAFRAPPLKFPPLPPLPPRAPMARPRIPAASAVPPIIVAPPSPPPPPANASPDTPTSSTETPVETLERAEPDSAPVETPTPVIDSPTAALDDIAPRLDAVRPVAPMPPRQRGKGLRYTAFVLVLLLIVGGIAALAIKLKDRPEDIMRPRAQQTLADPSEPSSKIVERIGAGTAPTTPARPAAPPNRVESASPRSEPAGQPGVPIAQRAALLVDAPDEPQNFKTYVGSVVWRLESVNRGAGQALAQGVRAEAEIPEAKLKVSLLFQRNTDEAIPASHMITVSFTPAQDSFVSGVDDIDMPQMRNEVSPAVDSLFGVQARITQNIFLVGLAKDSTLIIRNVDMLRSRGWLDIPLRLADGRIAKITLEKGPAGDRAIADALASWGQ